MAQNGVSAIASGSTQQGFPYAHIPHDSALSVGSSKAEEDAAKIRDLEDEVRILAEKANTASQRFADYENEIRVLEAKLRQEQRKNSAPTTTTVKVDSPDSATPSPITPQERPGISRFGSFIGSRNKTSPAANGTLAPPSGSREKELEEKLIQEQTTRIAAEKKVKEVNAEIEDLSATLFQQANEMVATERKEKAALTEKNEALRDQIEKLELEQKDKAEQREKQEQQSLSEKQAAMQKAADEKLSKENERLKEKLRRLEQREAERKKRLERLEAASKRVERVKAMLQPP